MQQTLLWNITLNQWTYKSNATFIANHKGDFASDLGTDSCVIDTVPMCPYDDRETVLFFGGRDKFSQGNYLYAYKIGTDPLPVCSTGNYLSTDFLGRRLCVPCLPGTYNTKGDGVCVECPDGAVCPGGSVVNSKRGYWQNPDSLLDPRMYLCPIDSCCQSDESGCSLESQCKLGIEGPLCSICSSVGHSLWAAECVPCTSPNYGYFAVYFFGVLGIVAILTFSSSNQNLFINNLVS